MANIILKRVFHLLSLLYLLPAATVSDELQTLLAVRSSFRNSGAGILDSWESNTSVCRFPGITCNSAGLVSGIDLSGGNLTGSLPVSSICELKSLERLSLGFNSLHGPVGRDLNACFNLKYLDLGNNWFSGPFPDISSLNKLDVLHLNGSNLSGDFPWDSLRNMTGLRVLSLGDNPFNPAAFPTAVLNLTRLNWLYLSNCSITGKIPEEIGILVELINLELSQNYITGSIPRGITRLTNLWQLELYENELTGKFPPGLGNLTNLEFFDASDNHLLGNLSEIRLLSKLKSLQLYDNQISGQVPDELGDFRNLVNLSLYRNNLTGPLPMKLGSWAEFNFIDVSENFLTGSIPPEMCNKGTMEKLLMLDNGFTGEIPGSYSNCKTLIRFRVSKNRLSGHVPGGIWGLPEAKIIDLANNDLDGPVTPDIGNARSLAQLFLANNRFSDELPSDISRASSLVSIDLSNNQFSGDIPATIGELKQLTTLQLQGDKFSGLVPDSLASCHSINEINMAENRLSGPIPASLGTLSGLNFLNLSGNCLSGSIPGTLSALRLNLLDLSNNQLTGPIPESLLAEANNGSFTGNPGLCSDRTRGLFQQCTTESGTARHLRTALFCLMVASVTAFVGLAVFCYFNRRGSVCKRSLKYQSWDLKSFRALTFTEGEILDSIRPENLIGKGGSGNVYRVIISNGQEFAVKHIWHGNGYDARIGSSTPILPGRGAKSKELEAEVRALSSIRHVNVVKLYCSICSDDSSLLVYEYMPNGSLWDRLHGCKKLALDWETRYEVALGAARGLEYLHHGCDRPVIHRDVKSSNILLDEHLKPCIADFGLAKIVQANSVKDSSQAIIAGTHGYIAPEYAYTSKVNQKGDVYSFGVVLMEAVTGRQAVEAAEFGEGKDIVDWVFRKLKTEEGVMRVLDSDIFEGDRESAIQVLQLAIHCTARNPSLRPTMRAVVQLLEKIRPCQLLCKKSQEL